MLRHIIPPNTGQVINFLVDPSATFYPGHVAQLRVAGNQILCGVSDGISPIGVIDDIKNQFDDSTAGSGQITIWMSLQYSETDMFDTQCRYDIGSYLYVNKQGILTTTTAGYPVGIVKNSPTVIHAVLGFSFDHQPYRNFQFFPNQNGGLKSAIELDNGKTCDSCKEHFPYADQSNQPNGGFKCWKCRNGI